MGLYGNLTLFFPDLSAFKTLFELSRVKLYIIFLKGDEHYFELAGGSSSEGSSHQESTVTSIMTF